MTLGKTNSLNHDENDHDEVRRIAMKPFGGTQNTGHHGPDNAAKSNKGGVDAHDKRTLLSAKVIRDKSVR